MVSTSLSIAEQFVEGSRGMQYCASPFLEIVWHICNSFTACTQISVFESFGHSHNEDMDFLLAFN